MREIILSTPNTPPVIVDDKVYLELSKHKWHLRKSRYDKTGYAVTGIKTDNKYKSISMHHLILPLVTGLEVDHINGNSLDNRRENLRLVTHKENCAHFKFMFKHYLGPKKKDCCKQGHKFTEGSIYQRMRGKFLRRECKICSKLRSQRTWRRKNPLPISKGQGR